MRSYDVFFVTRLQGWVYKTKQTCVMHASNQMLLCNKIARMFTKHNMHNAMWCCYYRLYKMITKDSSRMPEMCWFSGMLWSFVTTLCSPNEDFGLSNKPFGEYFRSTFQRVVAQILYSLPWKVLQKDTTDLLFCLPKSSFGGHKVGKKIQKMVATCERCDALVFLGCYDLL